MKLENFTKSSDGSQTQIFYLPFKKQQRRHIDFFVNESWTKLPHCWQHFLENTNPVELGKWFMNDSEGNSRVWPLGLQSFRASINLLSLERKYDDLKKFKDFVKDTEPVDPEAEKEISAKLNNLLKRRVKPKKQHEVRELAKVVKSLAKSTETNSILDIGSGVGHLSRYLSIACTLEVISLECQEDLTSTADELNRKLYRDVNGKCADHAVQSTPVQMCKKLEMNDDIGLPSNCKRIGIIGLHTCGNLAVTTLNLFKDLPECTFVVSLGCCYNKLTDHGFPLSQIVRSSQTNITFSYEALELSCHAYENYMTELIQGKCEKLKIHCYRAALEFLIVKNYPSQKRLGLRGVKEFANFPFSKYAGEALADYPSVQLSDRDLESPNTLSMLSDWWKIICFQTIRQSMARIVETIILLDRVAFLQENDLRASIVPVFDECISPRNLAIIGYKDNCDISTTS